MFVKEQHWKLLHFHYLSSSTGKSESISISFIYYSFKKKNQPKDFTFLLSLNVNSEVWSNLAHTINLFIANPGPRRDAETGNSWPKMQTIYMVQVKQYSKVRSKDINHAIDLLVVSLCKNHNVVYLTCFVNTVQPSNINIIFFFCQINIESACKSHIYLTFELIRGYLQLHKLQAW